MIAGLAITTLLAAIFRQEDSEAKKMPFKKMAEQLWVLWDIQSELGSPLAPSNVKPDPVTHFSLLKVALPPGWTWTLQRPAMHMTIPDRKWQVRSGDGHFFAANMPFAKALEMIVFGRVRPELYVGFDRTTKVLHPGWTEKMLFEVQLACLEAMLEEMMTRDLPTEEVAILEEAFQKVQYRKHRQIALRDSLALTSPIRNVFFLLKRIADYNGRRPQDQPLLLRDILTSWTGIRTGENWGIGTWDRFVEAGTAQFMMDRIREHLVKAELPQG